MYWKTFRHYCIFFLILCFSCKPEIHDFTLNKSEFFIDDKTVSISKDELGNIWVGTESGDLYLYDYRGIIHYDLEEDQIYKAALHISSENDTLLWVASRNSGLQVWDIGDIHNLRKIRVYGIDIKGENFSPYDFIFLGNEVYVSTSLGFYKTDIDNYARPMELVYPSKEELLKRQGNIYIFRNLIVCNDTVIAGATSYGIKEYNINTKLTNTLMEGSNIEHISTYADTMYAISGDFIYRIVPSGDILKNNIGKRTYMFFRDINHNNFLVTQNNILFTPDFDAYTNIDIHRTIPIKSNIHSLMVSDNSDAFSILITNSGLLRLASHITDFSENDIISSCFDEQGNYYFVTGLNRLYTKQKGASTADWIFSFDEKDPVVWMDVAEKEIYMQTASNSFYKMRLKDEWYKNILQSPQFFFSTPSKITAMHLHKHQQGESICFIGTQEGLFYLSNDSVRSIPHFSGMYITSFFEAKNTDRIYVSTLNDGIHTAGDDHLNYRQITVLPHQSFIRDLIVTNEHYSSIIILTNHKLLLDNKDSGINSKDAKKIIQINDTCFASVLAYGINLYDIRNEKVIDQGRYYTDISFNPNACFAADGKLILGSNMGVMTISPQTIKHTEWIRLKGYMSLEILLLIALSVLFLIVLTGYIIRFSISKQRGIRDAQILKLQDDQITRINDVQTFVSHLLDENSKLEKEIYQIQDYLNALHITNKTESEKREIKGKLEKISLQIADINRKISLHLPFKINEQKEILSRINNIEAQILAEKTNRIKNTDNVGLIYNIIKENQLWLDKFQTLQQMIDIDIDDLSRMLIVNGVNHGIYDRLATLKINIPSMNVSEISDAYDCLKQELDRINSYDNKIIIGGTLSDISKIVERETKTDSKLLVLDDYLNSIKNMLQSTADNTYVLMELKKIDTQLKVLEILNTIKLYANKYKEVFEQILKENDERITQKSQSELDAEIELKNRVISHKVTDLINELYNILPISDQLMLINVLKINKEKSQNAKVLALLLADKHMKRIIIPRILGIVGNLNPVISRLINDRIKPNLDQIKNLKKTNEYSILIIRIVSLVGDE